MKKLLITEVIVLLCGTLFAWFNFGREFLNWMDKKACTTGCSVGLESPFLSSCFYGAIFFTIAFVISILLYRKYTKNK